ncbi:hypothetical protein [Rubrivirga sp.]|uniref:hypothetical protein n=1 Tax=Rubrivirga sp. TaxID=1885344 RepID=UPI003C777F35
MRRALFLAALLVPLTATAQEYRPAYERDEQQQYEDIPELVLVYFGQSTCIPCQDPAFKSDLERAKVLLTERAALEGKSFSVVGAALDWSIEDGMAFLATSGAFDEIAVGRNWGNTTARLHLWRPDGLEERMIAIPSVMVFERARTPGSPTALGEPTYRFEVAGAAAMADWVAAGAPLD